MRPKAMGAGDRRRPLRGPVVTRSRLGGAARALPPLPIVPAIHVPLHLGEKKASSRSKARKGAGARQSLRSRRRCGEKSLLHSPTYTTGEPNRRSEMVVCDMRQGSRLACRFDRWGPFITPIAQRPIATKWAQDHKSAALTGAGQFRSHGDGVSFLRPHVEWSYPSKRMLRLNGGPRTTRCA
jgi:hypothetical protein